MTKKIWPSGDRKELKRTDATPTNGSSRVEPIPPHSTLTKVFLVITSVRSTDRRTTG
ncbi:uncharacterized protein METZ01_LOCUS58438 [marine metagenome]|uniref:Uncharacterized protein n=1 Tax=marine metagenome TaxID=408172 RepID=A0A381SQA2_9ZZZZ